MHSIIDRSNKQTSWFKRLAACATLTLSSGLTLVSAPHSALAADADKCQDVTIKVENEHPSGNAIRILYIKYQKDGTGDFFEEGLNNAVPNVGVEAIWRNQTLQNAPENYGYVFRVYFQEQLSSGTFPTYDVTHYQEFSRLGSTCVDGRSYTFTVSDYGIIGK